MASDMATLFISALPVVGLTLEQASQPHTLTTKQLRDRKWCYDYATAQVKHQSWLHTLTADSAMSDDEWTQAINDWFDECEFEDDTRETIVMGETIVMRPR
jgi:hypothetical protein